MSITTKEPFCTFCSKKFSNFQNFQKHLRRLHSNVPIPVKKRKILEFQCNMCTRQFSSLANLKHHQKKAHHILQKIELVLCPFCQIQVNKTEILYHYELEHGLKLETKRLNFRSFEEFKLWKEIMENRTCSKYSLQSTKPTKEKKMLYFSCNRSGFYRSKVKIRKRALKTGGSWKINYICPAKLKATIKSDGTCSVLHIKTHVGHKTNESLIHKSHESLVFKSLEDLEHGFSEGSEYASFEDFDDVSSEDSDNVSLQNSNNVSLHDSDNVSLQDSNNVFFKEEHISNIETSSEDLKDVCTEKQMTAEQNIKKRKEECLKKFQSIVDSIKTEEEFTCLWNKLESLEHEIAVQNLTSSNQINVGVEQKANNVRSQSNLGYFVPGTKIGFGAGSQLYALVPVTLRPGQAALH